MKIALITLLAASFAFAVPEKLTTPRAVLTAIPKDKIPQETEFWGDAKEAVLQKALEDVWLGKTAELIGDLKDLRNEMGKKKDEAGLRFSMTCPGADQRVAVGNIEFNLIVSTTIPRSELEAAAKLNKGDSCTAKGTISKISFNPQFPLKSAKVKIVKMFVFVELKNAEVKRRK